MPGSGGDGKVVYTVAEDSVSIDIRSVVGLAIDQLQPLPVLADSMFTVMMEAGRKLKPGQKFNSLFVLFIESPEKCLECVAVRQLVHITLS